MAAPASTDSRSRRPAPGYGRSSTRAGLAKPQARPVGTPKASTSGEFPRVSVTDSRLVEAGGIRTPNANTILPPRSVIEANRKQKLIDPVKLVDEALRDLSKKAAPAYNPKAAAAGPKGVLNIAKKYLGVPYLWGGTNPNVGLDCSGYVQLVFRQVGINLPRVSRDQAKVGRTVPSLAQARPGDLVFYSKGGVVYHDGIYAGNGMYYAAPYTGSKVSLRKVGNPDIIKRVL